MNVDQLELLDRKLKQKDLVLKREWLETCCKYLRKSLGNTFPSTEKLFALIVHQFLNSPLSETMTPLMKIPTKAVKVVISKRMVFQVISYTNISVSLYEQLSEITRHNEDLSWFHGGSNVEEHDEENREKEEDTTFHGMDRNNNKSSFKKPMKRGMLKIEMTDGVNTVKGIELEEVFDEKLLVPGSKILLVNRVKCRRGILLLDKSNCCFLGGQIDSLKIVKKKQLSEALNVDLDAEKKRRRESLAKAAAAVSRYAKKKTKNASLNQSTISPFLVKTDRKTGEVTNPPKPPAETSTPHSTALTPLKKQDEPAENWDFSIEEIFQHRDPTPDPPRHEKVYSIEEEITHVPQTHNTKQSIPPPIKRLSELVLGKQEKPKTVESVNSAKKLNGTSRENRSMEDWTFNSSSSSFEKDMHWSSRGGRKSTTKELPDELLKKEVHLSNPEIRIIRHTVEDPKIPVEKTGFEIQAWARKDKRRPEKFSAKRKSDDSDTLIPPYFLNQKIEKSVEDRDLDSKRSKINSFARTIHGPIHIAEKPRKVLPDLSFLKQESSRTTPNVPTGKGDDAKSKSANFDKKFESHKSDKPKEAFGDSFSASRIEQIMNEEDDEDDDEEEQYLSMISELKQRHVKPTTSSSNQHFDSFDEEINANNSIMECTIEKEGRQELERWGLGSTGNNRKRNVLESDRRDEISSYSSKKKAGEEDYLNLIHRSRHPGPSSAAPIEPRIMPELSSNFASQQSYDPKFRKIKIERVEEPEITTTRATNQPERQFISSQDDDVMKNKRSLNVQIYKTPFAKRLTSSDDPSSMTSRMFQRLSDLNIVPLADGLTNRKFWMMSKIIVVMPTICHQLHDLKSDGIDWILQISLTDTTAANVRCRVATDLLNRIFGFTVQQCKALFNAQQVEELRAKKCDAERKLMGFKRLDLLVWIEVSPDLEKQPLILDVKTISDALNIL